jgi:hypothetical protein
MKSNKIPINKPKAIPTLAAGELTEAAYVEWLSRNSRAKSGS